MNTPLQTSIDFSRRAAIAGMNQAEQTANNVHKDWSESAYNFLKEYIRSNPQFMVEDVRYASQGKVPSPPSQRAWGGIIVRAAKEHLIIHAGYSKTKNVKAHATPAAVWRAVK